jgi:hypothetical protein
MSGDASMATGCRLPVLGVCVVSAQGAHTVVFGDGAGDQEKKRVEAGKNPHGVELDCG